MTIDEYADAHNGGAVAQITDEPARNWLLSAEVEVQYGTGRWIWRGYLSTGIHHWSECGRCDTREEAAEEAAAFWTVGHELVMRFAAGERVELPSQAMERQMRADMAAAGACPDRPADRFAWRDRWYAEHNWRDFVEARR